jgi:hypothetical protein
MLAFNPTRNNFAEKDYYKKTFIKHNYSNVERDKNYISRTLINNSTMMCDKKKKKLIKRK